MIRTAEFVICCALATCVVLPAAGQSTMRETNPPAVTADAESWYLSGTPVTFAGRTYYPAGPRVHFIPSEMVPSGEFRGIPLYSRTTIEPYSVVFVPIAGGLFQPYERRRDGDLAGTVGSSAPSFPVTPASEEALEGNGANVPQAAAPPTLGRPMPSDEVESSPRIVGTAGTVVPEVRGNAAVTRTGRAVTARRPAAAAPAPRRADASNGIFITYAGDRWFSSGSPVAFDPSRFVETGRREGFPIYRDRTAPEPTIYVPVVKGTDGLLAPYSKRR